MAQSFRWIGRTENTVELKKFTGDFNTTSGVEENSKRTGMVLDLETTGLNSGVDKIIEIGYRLFDFNRLTGELLGVRQGFSAFEDPLEPLSPKIIQLTGITDEDVKGQQIPWDQVASDLEVADLIVAHNASFDRGFLDKKLEVSRHKIWTCSLQQVDWTEKGFTSAKLELLTIYHGFFTDAHRALEDADALLHLLSHPMPESNSPYFLELIENARKTYVYILAYQAPFESKDALKSKDYRWDNQKRVWKKIIPESKSQNEIKWLESSVYHGSFEGEVRPLKPIDLFKN